MRAMESAKKHKRTDISTLQERESSQMIVNALVLAGVLQFGRLGDVAAVGDGDTGEAAQLGRADGFSGAQLHSN